MENIEKTEIDKAVEKIENKPKPVIDTKSVRVFDEKMSENIGNLAGALAKAQGQMTNGTKGKAGYGYKYMELGSLIDIVRPALTSNGLAVIQSHEFIGGAKPTVVTHTTLIHESNEWMKSSLEIPIAIMKQLSAAQMIGVASTYGRRYSLQALCLIASEDDTDGTVKK